MEWVNARAGAGNRKVKWKEEEEKWNESSRYGVV